MRKKAHWYPVKESDCETRTGSNAGTGATTANVAYAVGSLYARVVETGRRLMFTLTLRSTIDVLGQW